MSNLGRLEEQILMAVLRQNGDAYGVSIQREIADKTGKQPSLGAIYTTLKRMEEKSFVSWRKGEATAVRGGRAKTLYRIEAPGQQALSEAQQVAAAFHDDIGVPQHS